MPKSYDIPHDEAVEILKEIIDEHPASTLLSIPGVYEALNEEFNNEIIKRWEAKQPQEDEEEDEDET